MVLVLVMQRSLPVDLCLLKLLERNIFILSVQIQNNGNGSKCCCKNPANDHKTNKQDRITAIRSIRKIMKDEDMELENEVEQQELKLGQSQGEGEVSRRTTSRYCA